jgi:ATP-dependent Clp protease ATP-binding subunit ClpB
LLDEIEKAHPDVWNILLQVLDDGHLTDNKGRTVNFKNTIIIMTSNIGSHIIQEIFEGVTDKNLQSKVEKSKTDVMALLKQTIRPEFLNRVDDTIMFNTLSEEDIKKITRLELDKLVTRLVDMKYKITYNETLVDYISKIGYDATYGARPMKRAIQDKVEDFLSEEVLTGRMVEGKTYNILVDNEEVKIVKKGR